MITSPQTVPVKLVPESVPSLQHEGEKYVYKKAEINFLREYASSLDEDVAFAQLGLDSRRKSEILASPYVKAEMSRIQDTWRYRSRLTQDVAAGEHMRLMEKFEGDYDNLKVSDRPKMAGVLAKMSEGSMKATGLIGSERDQAMPTVIIRMNMGDDANVAVQVNQTGDGNG